MSMLKNVTVGLLTALLLGTGSALVPDSVSAQNSDIDPLEGLGTDDDGSGPFGTGDDPFDLFHRAVLAPSIGREEFRDQQQRAITNEAESFRLRQQEALRQEGPGDLEAVDAGEVSN